MSIRLRRREFIATLGAAAAWPLAAPAQQPVPRVGFVVGSAVTSGASMLAALREGLGALGWVEGRNIEIVAHFGADDPEKIQAYVAEFIRLGPDAIVAGNSAMVAGLMKETHTIPIVLANVTDPIALGLVENLARPGGNVTGFTNFEAATAAKWLEFLREIAPSVTRVLTLVDATQLSGPVFARAIEGAGLSLRIPVMTASIREDSEIERAIDDFARLPGGGLIVAPAPGLSNRRALVLRLVTRHRLPNVIPTGRAEVAAGGLISYAPDTLDLFRRSASYVDRILKGARPGDLPIQNPIKYELLINLKAAKALGLTVRGDRVMRRREFIIACERRGGVADHGAGAATGDGRHWGPLRRNGPSNGATSCRVSTDAKRGRLWRGLELRPSFETVTRSELRATSSG